MEEDVLKFIGDFIEENGFSPTVREVADGCNLSSPSVAKYYMDMLRDEGKITWETGKPRTVRIVEI